MKLAHSKTGAVYLHLLACETMSVRVLPPSNHFDACRKDQSSDCKHMTTTNGRWSVSRAMHATDRQVFRYGSDQSFGVGTPASDTRPYGMWTSGRTDIVDRTIRYMLPRRAVCRRDPSFNCTLQSRLSKRRPSIKETVSQSHRTETPVCMWLG
jgi:hypothetical protein